jgi:hypothetical protein
MVTLAVVYKNPTNADVAATSLRAQQKKPQLTFCKNGQTFAGAAFLPQNGTWGLYAGLPPSPKGRTRVGKAVSRQ